MGVLKRDFFWREGLFTDCSFLILIRLYKLTLEYDYYGSCLLFQNHVIILKYASY